MLMTIQDKSDLYFVMEFTKKQICEFQLQHHCEKKVCAEETHECRAEKPEDSAGLEHGRCETIYGEFIAPWIARLCGGLSRQTQQERTS